MPKLRPCHAAHPRGALRPLQFQTPGKFPATGRRGDGHCPALLELPPPELRGGRALRALQRETANVPGSAFHLRQTSQYTNP
ncbi:MAG: hypothetical protein DYG98_21260 [Haliscomenobacteraceae bacterium CHB4]|nr:hypothetical protein [Haliscomenobacteraceae bacterium CHB4]